MFSDPFRVVLFDFDETITSRNSGEVFNELFGHLYDESLDAAIEAKRRELINSLTIRAGVFEYMRLLMSHEFRVGVVTFHRGISVIRQNQNAQAGAKFVQDVLKDKGFSEDELNQMVFVGGLSYNKNNHIKYAIKLFRDKSKSVDFFPSCNSVLLYDDCENNYMMAKCEGFHAVFVPTADKNLNFWQQELDKFNHALVNIAFLNSILGKSDWQLTSLRAPTTYCCNFQSEEAAFQCITQTQEQCGFQDGFYFDKQYLPCLGYQNYEDEDTGEQLFDLTLTVLPEPSGRAHQAFINSLYWACLRVPCRITAKQCFSNDVIGYCVDPLSQAKFNVFKREYEKLIDFHYRRAIFRVYQQGENYLATLVLLGNDIDILQRQRGRVVLSEPTDEAAAGARSPRLCF